MESQFVFSQLDLKNKKKLRHWEFHFDNSAKNDHIVLLVSESSVPLSILKTSCARVGALKLWFLLQWKVIPCFIVHFLCMEPRVGPRWGQEHQGFCRWDRTWCIWTQEFVLPLFGACGALFCTVFVEQNGRGNDSFGIAVILGLYRSHRGHRKIKLLKWCQGLI